MNLFDVYSLYDIEPIKGVGNYVYTADGEEYLDLYGGHAVISIGHSHPHYVNSIKNQVENLGFYSNSVKNGLQNKLASLLGELSGYDDYSLFLCNSGAEANENAMKLASFETGRKKILAFNGAFHGRTSGAVAATDNNALKSPFNLTDNIVFASLNDIETVEKYLETNEFAAVIIEGIQGVAGIKMVSTDFMQQLRELTRKYSTLLILDEVQSGCGRTGKFFAHQHADVKPDIITMAKGIANGFPVGAVLIAPEIKAKKGMLGTTFGGNHLACAAACATLEVIRDENLVKNAAEVGEYIFENLKDIPGVNNLRGKGLMIGFDVDIPASEYRKKLLFEHHIFTGGAGASTVRLLPALSLTKEKVDQFIATIKNI